MEDKEISKEDKKNSIIKELLSWLEVILIAFVLAFFISEVVIINAEVPTGSMENTIMTDDRMIGFRLAYLFSEPERGDIVIFKYPDDESVKYVKRVIGLPGETVEIVDGKVYIDGNTEPLPDNYLKEPMVGSFGPYTVPEGCYFMLGDNRNISKDSRYWDNTYVKKEQIIGKVLVKYESYIIPKNIKWIDNYDKLIIETE